MTRTTTSHGSRRAQCDGPGRATAASRHTGRTLSGAVVVVTGFAVISTVHSISSGLTRVHNRIKKPVTPAGLNDVEGLGSPVPLGLPLPRCPARSPQSPKFPRQQGLGQQGKYVREKLKKTRGRGSCLLMDTYLPGHKYFPEIANKCLLHAFLSRTGSRDPPDPSLGRRINRHD